MADKWRLLIPEQIDETGPRSLSDIVDSTVEYGDTDDVRENIKDVDAIIHRSVRLDGELIERAERLKVISKHGIGLDSIDIETASERGVVVCNTPGATARTVAEAAITLVLATRRNLVQADGAVRDGNWNARANWDQFRRQTVQGDTLGLFGFGDIAKEAAEMALGLGMECVTFDPYIDDDDVFEGVTRVSEKQALFEAADTVSVHTPLTDETRHAIGLEELREIDYVVNTARGGVVDEDALLEALDADLVAAGLDVLEEEPPAPENPLLDRDDVILSPHIGTLSMEGMQRASLQAAENVRTVYNGDIPESTVNGDRI